jgi:hypothetical protein
LQLLSKLDGFLVMLAQLLDALRHFLQAVLQDLVRELLFVEDDHFLDGADTPLQVLSDSDDLPNDDGRARKRLEHPELPALDALGDFHFALAREQRDGTHFPQVHADRIVGLLQGAGRKVEFDVFAGLDFLLELLAQIRRGQLGLPLKHIDALRADSGEQVVQVFGRVDVVRDEVVHLAVRQVTLLLARIDQFLDVVVLIFQSQCNPSPAASKWKHTRTTRLVQQEKVGGKRQCRNPLMLAQSPTP